MTIKFDDEHRRKPYPMDPEQKLIMDLAFGRRKPQNDHEQRLLDQIRDAESRGYMIDLPLEL